MSRRLQAVVAPCARACSSSGTSSRANFARPNGNSSTSTTLGRELAQRLRDARAADLPRALGAVARVAAAERPAVDAQRRQRDDLDVARRRRCRRAARRPRAARPGSARPASRSARSCASGARGRRCAGSRRAARASCRHRLRGEQRAAGVEQLAQAGEQVGAVAADRGQRLAREQRRRRVPAQRGLVGRVAVAAQQRAARRAARGWRSARRAPARGPPPPARGSGPRGRAGRRCRRRSSSALRRFASPWISTGSRSSARSSSRASSRCAAGATSGRTRAITSAAVTRRVGVEPGEPRDAVTPRACACSARQRGAERLPGPAPGRAVEARPRRAPPAAGRRPRPRARAARGRRRPRPRPAVLPRRAAPWRRRARVRARRGTRRWRTARRPTRRGGGSRPRRARARPPPGPACGRGGRDRARRRPRARRCRRACRCGRRHSSPSQR